MSKSHTTINDLDCDPQHGRWEASRLATSPLIYAGLDPSIGVNIQGPSLIRVPEWLDGALGRYYLYFADHKGRHIRLAYADKLIGPWHIHVPGALQLEDSHFPTQSPPRTESTHMTNDSSAPKLLHSVAYEASTPHIASPDVHVNHAKRRIDMYFHGLVSYGKQMTRFASSKNGIDFFAEAPILCPTYLRVVPYLGRLIGMHMPGVIYEMNHANGPFENGTQVLTNDARHHALLVNRQRLFVFWTQVGEAPEHIKASYLDLGLLNKGFHINHLGPILKPELAWEGSHAPLKPSVRSSAYGCVNQLRDPCIFVEEGRVYLLYAGGGESAIGIAELRWIKDI